MIFNNLSISKKLGIYILLPLLSILFFASTLIVDKHQQLKLTQNILHFSHVVNQLSELIYQLQKERGLSTGFIGSRGVTFSQEVVNQRQNTDIAIKKLSENLVKVPDYLTGETEEKFNKLSLALTNLDAIRLEIDQLLSDDFFDFYSKVIAEALALIRVTPILNATPELTNIALSYIDILWLEERSAQERGALNNLFSSEMFSSQQFNTVLSYIFGQQDAQRGFSNIATREHQQLLSQVMSHSSAVEVNSARDIVNNRVIKQELLNELYCLIGYGGLIHNFKNYVIRGRQYYLEKVHDQFEFALQTIKTYQGLPNLDEGEKTALTIIADTLKRYQEHISTISKMKAQNSAVSDIDKFVAIDDQPAIDALNRLQLSITTLDPQVWWQHATQRLDLIHNVSSTIMRDLSLIAYRIEVQTQQLLTMYLFLTLMIFIFATVIGIKLRSRLVGQIRYIADNMRESEQNQHFNNKLSVIGKDEISDMAHAFNNLIDERDKNERNLLQIAHYDVLTGLPNRVLFTDRFQQAIVHSRRTDTQLAICFLDVDNFKLINDSYGHDIGNQLLIEVANRITGAIREEDTVSRQSGDEFAILLGEIKSYKQFEQTLTRVYKSLTEVYIIDNREFNITVSSGVTLYPEDNSDEDTLLRHADHAMYQAKQLGRNRYHLFDNKYDQEMESKQQRLTEIEHALNNEELCLYYQPKVNMLSGDVFGVEALIRWNHPEYGLVPPLEFLPVIENTVLEISVGDWVVNQALKQLEVWQQQDIKIEVSVNISSYHLQSENFFGLLTDALAKHSSVDPSLLQLEILESSVLSDINTIGNCIKKCRDSLGLNVALDDFGTGYSSLTHLRNLPVNIIKIDQTFVRDMLDDPSDYAIVDGVMGLAQAFDRGVIAEGVETTEHGLMLLLMGCENAQGYGIARPIPAYDFPLWLADYTPNQDWLKYASNHYSHKSKQIEIFKLITEQWKNKFISNIQSTPEEIKQWTMLDLTQCQCGLWIKRARQEQIFTEQNLNQLDKFHEELHVIALNLYNQYVENELDLAREGLNQLQACFDKMMEVLG